MKAADKEESKFLFGQYSDAGSAGGSAVGSVLAEQGILL